MKYWRIIPVVYILLNAINLYGQTVHFGYDPNGNRISRSIIVEEVQPNSVNFPLSDPLSLTPKSPRKSFRSSNEQETDKSEPELSEIKASEKIIPEDTETEVRIFPNPTKGLLRIEVTNLPSDSWNEMRLYDMNGAELIVQKNFEKYSEMNLNHLTDGIYILRIRINTRVYDFKIIKNN